MRIIAVIALIIASLAANAQEDQEYRLEIGGGIGLTSYQGDLNGSITANMQPSFTAVAKYKWNPRMAIAATIGYHPIKGDYSKSNTVYPELPDGKKSFSNSIIDIGGRYEYNFWPYGTGNDYRGAKRLTPFLTAGIGLFVASVKGGTVVATNFPFGGGVKYKIAKRLNVTAEWVMRFTTSDLIDGVQDPYGITSSGAFKNKDSYSTLQVAVTYDLWAKCRTCHNDDY